MKMQYRITFALYILVLFSAGIAPLVAASNNTSDANITNVNGTNNTGTAVETGNYTEPAQTTVEPAVTSVKTTVTTVGSDTTVKPDDTTDSPIGPVDTQEGNGASEAKGENENPSLTPEQSPGFGIAAAIVVVLSAIYVVKKRR